jgi:hypothetical protein
VYCLESFPAAPTSREHYSEVPYAKLVLPSSHYTGLLVYQETRLLMFSLDSVMTPCKSFVPFLASPAPRSVLTASATTSSLSCARY